MSGRANCAWSRGLLSLSTALIPGVLALICAAPEAAAQQRREREPNSAYAERRAKLASPVEGPIVLWGFSGREESSPASVFPPEKYFYYPTGHNEKGAGPTLLPGPPPRRQQTPPPPPHPPPHNTIPPPPHT